ncbi:MAG: hypothetical protein IJP86_11795 [Synergistaceae bacterium]|nr:hypothetical protein [Synergistaceae bacterium]
MMGIVPVKKYILDIADAKSSSLQKTLTFTITSLRDTTRSYSRQTETSSAITRPTTT